jgi:ATP-dependent helicase/nuclease subunit B
MLRIVTGPFHPDLERSLVEDLRRLRHRDPTGPAAIVVPSAHLRARVRELLVLEAGLPLLNVHLLTFHQLDLKLEQERHTDARKPPAGHSPFARYNLVDDFYFQCLLGQITRRNVRETGSLRVAAASRGAQAALWATIRDLKDSAVDPAIASQALAEKWFEAEDIPNLQALFTVYASVLEATRTLRVAEIDDVSSMVTAWAADSPFLQGLRGLWYYGFYDLTQVQLSLFEAVIRCAPVTLLFPLEVEPAYEFGRRFLERHLLPLISSSEPISRAEPAMRPDDLRGDRGLCVQTMSAVGPEDELTIVCKEILTLVETYGYGFDDIGVVARGLQPYQAFLRRVFDQHRIPFRSTAVAPVMTHPAAKVFVQLAVLPVSRFTRRAVLDLLGSPFYRHQLGSDIQSTPVPRPDLWQLAVGELGIRAGEEDWQRLESIGSVEAPVGGLADEGDGSPVTIPAPQLRLLGQLVSRLIQDCHTLPREGTMAELTDAFVGLALRHLDLPGLTQEDDEPDHPVAAALRHVLAQLRQVDDIVGPVSWQDWAAGLTHLVEQAVVPIDLMDPSVAEGGCLHRGVQVLDAMAARGLPFRALFLVGLNEKVFPRYIREDAFLRDRQRRVLDATLGFKIDEKLAGYDEEQLLFALLRRASRERLYLTYQRADTDGRPLAPSPYLSQCGQIMHLPRRFSDRSMLPQFSRMLLTREELALRLVLDGDDPSSVLTAMGHEPALFRDGVEALRALEGSAQELGPRDGLVGQFPGHWEQLLSQGVAPTSLEDYARCPTRYFAKHLLRLEPVRQPLREGLPAHGWGDLAHASLRVCCERLVKTDWPAVAMAPEVLRRHAASAVEGVFSEYAIHHGTGHALLWDLAKETLVTVVVAMLEMDQEDYRTSRYRPMAFEVDAEGQLDLGGPDRDMVKVRGRLDRLDVGPSSAVRVVDYKFKLGRKMEVIDRDLVTSAVRGFRLQPPLYALMKTAPGSSAPQRTPDRIELRFLAPKWETVVDRSEFEVAIWRSPEGDRLRSTFKTLLQGLRSGCYVMLPADYCDYCEFSSACRRFHGPSWWRAHRASSARALRLLRKQKAVDSGQHESAIPNGAPTGG